jgi:hypothetical protein
MYWVRELLGFNFLLKLPMKINTDGIIDFFFVLFYFIAIFIVIFVGKQ